MSVRHRAVALAGAALLAGCATVGADGTGGGGGNASAPDDSVAITIAQGPCFGACPVYSATLDKAGAVRFEGKRFTAMSGVQTASRPPESFAAFRDFVAPYKPARGTTAETQDCEPRATDHPAITVTWAAADGTQTVLRHDTGCHSESGRATTEALRQAPEWLGITEWVKRAE